MPDEKNDVPESEAQETPVAEEPTAEAEETPVAEEPAPEPEDVAEAAEEPTGDVPADEAETVAEEAAAAEPAPEAEPEAAPAPAQAGLRPKRKRLPRSERHKHVKPKRERPKQRGPIVRLPKPEHERGRRQERRGVVVSSAMDKTIVVKVDTVRAHPRYKKVVRRSTKFHAHDEQNVAKVGDLVRIVETRPLSKTKNWRLAEVLEEAR
jgi:small subunit ribosomal protein S17